MYSNKNFDFIQNVKQTMISTCGKFILPNFGNFLRRHQASRVKSKDLYLEQYWGRLPPPPAGLG